jgi:predicted ester cyclase
MLPNYNMKRQFARTLQQVVTAANEPHRVLMQRYHAMWSAGYADSLQEMLAENCITHNLATGEEHGREFESQACRIWHAAFSEVQVNIEQMVVEGDKVTVYWRLSSTHTGPFMNIDATGKRIDVPGMEINRIAKGKIAEIWRLSDTMSLMQQLKGS